MSAAKAKRASRASAIEPTLARAEDDALAEREADSIDGERRAMLGGRPGALAEALQRLAAQLRQRP